MCDLLGPARLLFQTLYVVVVLSRGQRDVSRVISSSCAASLVAVFFPEIVADAILKTVFFMRNAGNGGASSLWFATWPWTGFFPLCFIPSSVKLDSAFYHQVSNGSKKGKRSGLTVNLWSTASGVSRGC